MNLFGILFFFANLIAAGAAYHWLPAQYGWVIVTAFLAVGFFALIVPEKPVQVVATLKGLRWKRNQFCRGWLITGDTGSGKTSSGINQLAHQVFHNEPSWGGLCIDEKGVYWETLAAMAAHYGRLSDLIHVQIRPDDASANWTPPHRFNLTGDRTIPFRYLRQIHRGHRHESWTRRRQRVFQKPGADAYRSRTGIALRTQSPGDSARRV